MRIAMFTDYFFPELGGIQDSIATISRALGRRGHQVEIYAPRYSARDYRRIGAAMTERDLGANVRVRRRRSLPFPSSTRQSRAAFPSPAAPAAMRRRRPDIIHTHSFFGIGLEALLNGAVLGIPVIGTNHTTVAGFAPHIPISLRRASAYVRWFHNRCDSVTAPSRSVFAELGDLHRPCQVISNPIDTVLFRPASVAERQALRARGGQPRPVITYAGRLGAEKNIGVLVRAMAVLRDRGLDADLLLAGHGAHEPILRSLAATLRIDRHVRFLGTLSQPDLAKLLRASHVFTIMSTSETQSMVLLQAMACGLPVVAADSRALPEFVTAANGILVPPHDPEALATALADLLAAPQRQSALGVAGRRIAEQYSVETVTDEWETLYRSVLQRSSAA
jgi:glycosyltransferase involved in cell wall biosynthesis